MYKIGVLAVVSMTIVSAQAAPLADFGFKSPSFNGQGYSSHVLTIENQEYTRKQQIQKDIQAALDKAKADANNTNLQKFLNNLESRIYAQISQNLATAMFASGGSNSGTLNFEGNTIFWTKDSSNVYLTVTDAATCTKTKTVTITAPGSLSLSITNTSVKCNGGTSGTATASPSGGVTPYTYSWSPSGGSAATATGLAAGTYTCTITDANNCTYTARILPFCRPIFETVQGWPL